MYRIARGGVSLWLAMGMLALFAVPGLVSAAPALAALGPFTGGPIAVDTPTVIANDQSVCAMRFSAAGLTPNTTYHVKLRFSPSAAPAGNDNRGYTWNGTSQAWIQERTVDPVSGDTDWTKFPAITTDAGGNWLGTGSNDWFYAKFGDTTKTGPYFLIVSLSTGGQGQTTNSATPVAVTVIDPATAGYWVHPGSPPASALSKRADVVAAADAANANAAPLALTRAETNSCDDDGNGTVDDEMPGLLKPGGFRLAVPTGQAVVARIQKTTWPAASLAFTNTTADVDIALGGSDTTPPSAATSLTVTPGVGSAALTWAAASDDTLVSGYDVYRWTDAPAGAGYTAAPVLIASTANTTYTDPAVAPGTDYHYIVRARDAATNVGPRSPQADVAPPGAVTMLTASPGDGRVTLSWTNPAVAPAGVKVVRTVGAPATLPTDGTTIFTGIGAAATDAAAVNGTAYFYTVFAFNSAGAWSAAASAQATPHAPAVTALGIQTPARIVDWNTSAVFTGGLTSLGIPVEARLIQLQRSSNGIDGWTDVGPLIHPQSGAYAIQYSTTAVPTQATFYRFSFAGDADYAAAASTPVKVTPRVKLGTPVAPTTVRHGLRFTAYGALTPKHTAGLRSVKLKCYRKSAAGKWVLKKTVATKNADYRTATRYKVALSLPSAGKWRLIASYAATAKYAATTSSQRLVTVK
jgi:hypothetical protein